MDTSESDYLLNKAVNLALIYRWLTICLAVVVLLAKAGAFPVYASWWFALFCAIYTAALTYWRRPAIPIIKRYPSLVLIDVAVVLVVLGLNGGWGSPFYLFALSPVVFSGLVFGLSRALITALVSSLIYTLAIALRGYSFVELAKTNDIGSYVQQQLTFFLMAATFGFPGTSNNRLARLSKSTDLAVNRETKLNQELENICAQLQAIHTSSLTWQKTAIVSEIVGLAMELGVNQLDFDRCAIGLRLQSDAPALHWWSCSRTTGEKHILEAPPGQKPSPDLLSKLGFKDAEHVADQEIRAIGTLAGMVLVEQKSRPSKKNRAPFDVFTASFVSALTRATLTSKMLAKSRLDERAITVAKIHDSVAQSITGALRYLELSRHQIQGGGSPTEYFDQSCSCLETAVQEFGEAMIVDSQAVSGDNFDLDLEKCRQNFGNENLRVEIDFDGPKDMPVKIANTLIMIVREALTNIRKHSGADLASISLKSTDSLVELVVTDNGRGIDMRRSDAEKLHFGLYIMNFLVQTAGGKLQIDSLVHEGTEIRATLPLAMRIHS